MTLRIMPLNMRKLRRLSKRRYLPIQLPQPPMNIRVSTSHIPDIRLEMLHVDGVEADHGCVEPYVGFGDVGPVVVGPGGDGGEVLLDAVEGGEEGCAGGFVGGGCGCEAGFVDAVVYGVVGPVVRFFDFVLEVCGEEFDFLVFFVD